MGAPLYRRNPANTGGKNGRSRKSHLPVDCMLGDTTEWMLNLCVVMTMQLCRKSARKKRRMGKCSGVDLLCHDVLLLLSGNRRGNVFVCVYSNTDTQMERAGREGKLNTAQG